MNKVIMIGYVATEPEVETMTGGARRATFRIAVQRRFANSQGVRQSDFFNVVAWRNNAEFIGKYIHKGRRIAIEGELHNNSYTAQDGSKRYNDQIVAENIEFADSKPSGNDNQDNADEPPPATAQPSGDSGQFTEVDDDELPF